MHNAANLALLAVSTAPLIANSALIGKFMAFYDARHVFSDTDVALAVTIARQLGFSLERRRAAARRLDSSLRQAVHSGVARADRHRFEVGFKCIAPDQGRLSCQRQLRIALSQNDSGGPGCTQMTLSGSKNFGPESSKICGAYTFCRIARNREVRWIESRSFISYDGKRRPRRVIGINITERKQAEFGEFWQALRRDGWGDPLVGAISGIELII